MGHYPGSVNSPNTATIYGPLPDHGKTNVALVLHTTETTGMPGFNGGDTAPHYVYDPTSRVWTMWAEYEWGYVGTLKGHSSACHGNCQAFQVEILAYSNPSYQPWVGDFTDDNYQDLADFYSWAQERYGIGDNVTPTPAGGWLYGTTSPHRLTCSEWDAFTGLTAHGAVPQNTHWDTGDLDLQRIHDLAGDNMTTHYHIGQEYRGYEEISWLLFIEAGGTVDPNLNSAQVQTALPWKTNVRLVQEQDFDLIGQITGMTGATLSRLKTDGLYVFGKELASLREHAYDV